MAGVEEAGPRRRTRMSAARRRESILQAAVQAFAESGYHATTVAGIARRIGVTEPVVFQNFGSKPALFAAALDHAAGQAHGWLAEAGGTHGPIGDPVAHVLGHPHADLLPPEQGGTPAAALGLLFADAVTLAADPALAEVSGQVLRSLAGHLADVVRRGQDDGSLAAGTDPEVAAWLLVSVLAARPLRALAMPAGLEPRLADLVARALGSERRG